MTQTDILLLNLWTITMFAYFQFLHNDRRRDECLPIVGFVVCHTCECKGRQSRRRVGESVVEINTQAVQNNLPDLSLNYNLPRSLQLRLFSLQVICRTQKKMMQRKTTMSVSLSGPSCGYVSDCASKHLRILIKFENTSCRWRTIKIYNSLFPKIPQ